jgi:hypothetical protein
MPEGKRSRIDEPARTSTGTVPEIAACVSGPGTTVFIEADNTDGWIATDRVVESRR